jgi:flagellar biosynthesis/type III secretory pathway protein FliH
VRFRRSRFGEVIERQLDLFVRDRRDVLDEVDMRLRAYNQAAREDAEELYGDYVDAVETGTELLADVRDHYASTLDDPEQYVEEFNRAVARRLPELALEIENR